MIERQKGLNSLTWLKVTVGCLSSTGNFQFVGSWNSRDVCCSSSIHHCICLHFRCCWASVCSLDVPKVLRNSFRSAFRDAVSSSVSLQLSFVKNLRGRKEQGNAFKRLIHLIDSWDSYSLMISIAPIDSNARIHFRTLKISLFACSASVNECRGRWWFEYKLEFPSCCCRDYVVTEWNEFQC